ncbi:hypothetical protein SteCoe_35558 [Stentor coeruleus]|uniref:RING-type domain-containing protein n=1 Tax=Stentor coeruleus TaxID=5963 RepID=A0A1R2ASD0_9CILI|nr:hypothetical protein SteCoe_35558 [Stentor coeruleus]
MDCEQVCLTCKDQQIRKVNPAGYHGLCAVHIIPSGQNQKCIHCNSIIPIIFDISSKHCSNCSSICQETYKLCGHDVCENCISKECPVCRDLCNFCRDSKDTSLMQCLHIICKECLKEANSHCPLCKAFIEIYDIECEYCLIKAKIIEIYECPHKICENCYGENENQCPFCKSLIKKDEKNKGLGVFEGEKDEGAKPQEIEIINKNLSGVEIPIKVYGKKEIENSDSEIAEKNNYEIHIKDNKMFSSPSSSSSKNSKEIENLEDILEKQPLLNSKIYKKLEISEEQNSERTNLDENFEIGYNNNQKANQKNKSKNDFKVKEYVYTNDNNSKEDVINNSASIDVENADFNQNKDVACCYKILFNFFFIACCCCCSLFWCCNGTSLNENEVNENSCFYYLLCLCCCKLRSLEQKYWIKILKKCTLCKRKLEKKN